MKTIKRTSILLCLFLTIAILTAGTVSALIPIYHINAVQNTDKYTYTFEVRNALNNPIQAQNYDWSFGDVTYSSYSSPMHTYMSSGEKIVTVSFDTALGHQILSTSVYPGV